MKRFQLYGRYTPNPSFLNAQRRQYFCFPGDVISYITQNPISADGLLKLQKTCKYFFAKNKIIICDKFIQHENDQLIYYDFPCNHFFNQAANFWLTGGLNIDSNSKNSVSKLIYRCSLKKLQISNQNFTLNEMNFLLNDGKINRLHLINVNIRDNFGVRVTIDKILLKVPNLQELRYDCPEEFFTTETFEKINALKFNFNFKRVYFGITQISLDLDLSLLYEFNENNFDETAVQYPGYRIHLKMYNKEKYVSILKLAVKERLQNWKNDKKPNVLIQ